LTRLEVSVRFVETVITDKYYRQIEGDGMSFDGQRVVIVGGSAGIGEATATAFAAGGAHVIITGRAKQRLDLAAQHIGHPVEVRELDATDGPAVREFFESAGPVDHLVLAASPGAVGSGPFRGLDPAALRQAFDGKFFAYVSVLQAALPSLRADGSVTIISAASARAAYPGAAGLAAVNGALEAIVPPLAVELAPLRVNAVSPGVIDTQWWHALPDGPRTAFFQAAAAASPVRRIGTPQDVAAAICYLAGAGFVTGTVLECTGGANLTVGAVAG
jgi:NAD(P)-dependent dehydrogenase (short-subunit alcohol dehydrogenase family)